VRAHLPLAKEEELEVRRHGNVLFAGWTVPISLGSTSKFVPPSCLFFEGYRELGTDTENDGITFRDAIITSSPK